MPGWISQVEQLWESPALRRLLERLAVFGRLILFDRRGSGLSDSVVGSRTPLSRRRVTRSRYSMRWAASGRRYSPTAWVDRSARCWPPIARAGWRADMYASIARTSWAPDYDWAMTVEDRAKWTERTVAAWGETTAPGFRCWRPRWPMTRRSRRGSRACSAWRRARAKPVSS